MFKYKYSRKLSKLMEFLKMKTSLIYLNLATSFVQHVEEAFWLSSIIVVPKKNDKLWICVDFQKLNATTKKDPCPLPFTNEILNTIVGHEIYSFFDGFFGYYVISIALEDLYRTTFAID